MTQAWPPRPATATCYQHPNRVAGVTCRRCGRPICPDCMVQASVGWHCPECTRAGARQSRTIRYRPGTPVGRLSWRSSPVTISLVLINVAAFLASRGGSAQVLVHWGLIPYNVAHFGKVGTLFTSPFLHLNVLHIGLNMLALVSVGMFVEATLGPWRYLIVYAASALGGSVAYYLIAPQLTPGVGASGAIFGMFGAYFVLARRSGVQTTPILIVIVINLVYGFSQPNVGWQAHIGGLVVGTFVACGFILAGRYRAATARGIEAATCVFAAGVLFALMQLQPFGSLPAVPFLPR